jgi:hypothetical protein
VTIPPVMMTTEGICGYRFMVVPGYGRRVPAVGMDCIGLEALDTAISFAITQTRALRKWVQCAKKGKALRNAQEDLIVVAAGLDQS